jgi:hypothetical protein
MHTKFWWEILRERYYLEGLGIDDRIIVENILIQRMVECEMDSYDSGLGSVVDSCEHGNELLSSIKFWLFINYLGKYYILWNSLLLTLWS